MWTMARRPLHRTRKVAVGIIGGVVVVIGIILIPLPGPGSLVIVGGLAILASEFPVAERAMQRVKDQARKVMPKRPPDPAEEPAVD